MCFNCRWTVYIYIYMLTHNFQNHLAGDRVKNNSDFLNLLDLSFKMPSHSEIVLMQNFVHEILKVCVKPTKQKPEPNPNPNTSTHL